MLDAIMPNKDRDAPSRRDPPTSPPDNTGRTRMLRQRLKARREALGLTQEQVAQLISDDPLRDDKPIGNTAVSNWETLKRHPKIDDFAAWARVLGMRLIVDLDDAESDRVPVLLPPGRHVELAKAISTLPDDDFTYVEALVRRLVGD